MGPVRPALATRWWSSKATWMWSGGSGDSICWVLLVSGWFSSSKTIIPEAGSTFSPLQPESTLVISVDSGLIVVFVAVVVEFGHRFLAEQLFEDCPSAHDATHEPAEGAHIVPASGVRHLLYGEV